VKVFQEILKADGHDHLKDFYLLVPSLCVSWMDNSLAAIDSMYKVSGGRAGAATARDVHHTDDGFAMGIAYVLAILKQTRRYESLHWKDSVKATHAAERTRIEGENAIRTSREEAEKKSKRKSVFGKMFGGKDKDKDKDEAVDMESNYRVEEEASVLQVSEKKLEAQCRAMEQLFFSMTGAGIFFRRN
jgi:WASH complex subunit 7